MPGTNLTREEASERASIVSTQTYDVQLDLTLDSETHFGSVTTIVFGATPGSSTFVDLVDGDISSITLNGSAVDTVAYADSRIALAGLAERNELVVAATLPYSHSGEGLHRFVDPVDGKVYLYTQFEVPDARRVFATFEQPDLKATFVFHVTAPSHWAVVSNSPTPEPVAAAEGTSTWHFAETKTMSTYITALVAGEYVSVTDSYRGAYDEIPLGVFCRQSVREHLDADDIFLITKQGFEFFENAFEMAYPFGKYDQLFVPEYNMGAMENAGAVTFRDEMIFRSRQTVAAYESRANTILHEMAHMWFGDLVTMKWWDDLWLNESFAEFAASHASTNATRFTDAWTSFTNARKNWAYRQDQLPSTHPIAADNYDLHAVEANFDGITYAKGASALKQLVAWVGEEDFFAGLRAYFGKHAYGNTQLSDLLVELEAASGRELGDWAAEWLQTSGVNTLRADFETDASGAFTSFSVEQTAIEAYPTLRRHRIAIGLYNRVDGKLVRTERVETDIRGASTSIDELVGKVQPDLILLNDDDLTYAKIRLDERSFTTLTESIATFEQSLPRALSWGSAWDMTRDAELSGSDFVTLVLAGVGSETDLTAVSSLLRQGNSAVNLYTAPDARQALKARWEAGLNDLVDAAEPGSDHQLALVRALASATSTPDRLRSILAGELDGLTLDTDLRWTLVTALARIGDADEAEIAAELERDNTISGQENASAARAIRPSTEAKEAAWQIAAVDPSTPNETRRSTAGAFQVSGQGDILEPYVDRYLELASTVVDDMGVWIGQVALVYLFPLANPSQATLDKVDAWLASTTANAAAQRYVSEGRDDLARALRAQAAS
ncbi:aminopeptidase N [Aeromicrobium fastidiosum]|uniref:Aminopeptidase N n=1 Tax=Aeromicrobium fastidiosum TaxID=52699 RepID=A0A641AM40_9ACTN|nr:aminopeptidase N [Aeromicrobium fastidiosum]KAA1378338.1 aminopeptidase N [Aeromicrobium fastidiosum]MBP2392715.1 aminopeptidase N [Aeromicrobium fastidiosum]